MQIYEDQLYVTKGVDAFAEMVMVPESISSGISHNKNRQF